MNHKFLQPIVEQQLEEARMDTKQKPTFWIAAGLFEGMMIGRDKVDNSLTQNISRKHSQFVTQSALATDFHNSPTLVMGE